MSWFETLTGCRETSPAEVRNNFAVSGVRMVSKANGRELVCGTLETPSLGILRQRVADVPRSLRPPGRIAVREMVADVAAVHADPANAGAMFQVASQFNLLEMIHPSMTPEHGVGIYGNDRTQGPACAIACGAGTIYRNYFVPVNGRSGQSDGNQLDCLADLGAALGNSSGRLWEMRNGYALPSPESLASISSSLRERSEAVRDDLRRHLRIGLQWHTQVTLDGCSHLVSQAYCSALPVSYARHSAPEVWSPFARLILEAAYEATICAALLNAAGTDPSDASRRRTLYLTLLGGGAFGNQPAWILDALIRAIGLYRDAGGLDVALISYRTPNVLFQQALQSGQL